jgi:hypothetical protein
MKLARIIVDDALINQVKTKYPELTRMNATDVSDWALRKSLQEKEA